MLRERKPNRLKDFDYSSGNLYFVTSCVKDRTCCLGYIEKGKLQLNIYGEIANAQWFWLAKQYTYVDLHAIIVMPNHIHGIIEIHKDVNHYWSFDVRTGRDLSLHQTTLHQPKMDKSDCSCTGIKIKSLSELIGAYKTTSSKQIHLAGMNNFAWQRSFYDHIIKGKIAYLNISNYLNNNPLNWKKDDFFYI